MKPQMRVQSCDSKHRVRDYKRSPVISGLTNVNLQYSGNKIAVITSRISQLYLVVTRIDLVQSHSEVS